MTPDFTGTIDDKKEYQRALTEALRLTDSAPGSQEERRLIRVSGMIQAHEETLYGIKPTDFKT